MSSSAKPHNLAHPKSKKPLRVALIHDFLIKMGGAERVLKVLADLYPEAPIYTLLYDEAICGKTFPRQRVIPSIIQRFPEFIRKRQRYLFPLMPRAIESFDVAQYDLVISSSSAYAHGILTGSHALHISYSHSPMRYLWDYAHEYLDEQRMNRVTRAVTERLLRSLRLWDFLASDRVDAYVANSHNVRQRIQKYYRKSAKVLYPPVEVDRFKPTSKHKDFFLIVSALTPFKKIDQAIQLFNKIGKKLVIIGSGSQYKFLKQIAGSNIEILGPQTDEVVTQHLMDCRAYLMPAEEDFGIAPVEAMACGKAVIAYGKGGVLETVIPGETGELFYEPTLASFEDALGKFIINENNYNAERIHRHAKTFSKQEFMKGWKEIVEKEIENYF